MTLIEIIKTKGITISHVAEKVGVQRPTINNWSNRPETITIFKMDALASVLNMDYDELKFILKKSC